MEEGHTVDWQVLREVSLQDRELEQGGTPLDCPLVGAHFGSQLRSARKARGLLAWVRCTMAHFLSPPWWEEIPREGPGHDNGL